MASSSSKKWAKFVSQFASLLYFLVIILQVPLFRLKCRIGICRTPIEVTTYQLFASEVLPATVIKPLLYPGAIAKALLNNKPFPSYDKLLLFYNLFGTHKQTATGFSLHHLEVLVGSYMCVAGAILGLTKRRSSGRISLFGLVLIIIWGVKRETAFAIRGDETLIILPSMFLALLSALFSMRRDVRKLIRHKTS
ncbi:hypothetical protein DM860_010134 [Cuscuta australis]|uniref:Uncharacterized protein n=1 Tax=Cuscuta australis TaxID=267555 RepID=A0A328D854_9ASTE|nr:hypothetical protein DM860_010134 [Cuscuta australis]